MLRVGVEAFACLRCWAVGGRPSMIPAPARRRCAQRHQLRRLQEPQHQRNSPKLQSQRTEIAGAGAADSLSLLPFPAFNGRNRRPRRLAQAAATIMLALQVQLRLCTAFVSPPLATGRLQSVGSAMAGVRRCGGGRGGREPAARAAAAAAARRLSSPLVAPRARAGGAATDAGPMPSHSPGEETETTSGNTGLRGAGLEGRRYVKLEAWERLKLVPLPVCMEVVFVGAQNEDSTC